MPSFARLLGAALVVRPLGVAAVDDRVALVEQLRELVDGLLCRIAGWHHDPHDPRRLELFDEIGQRTGAARTVLLRLGDGLLVEVERDHLVIGVAPDAVNHVPAHLAQSDESDLAHARHPSCKSGVGWCARVGFRFDDDDTATRPDRNLALELVRVTEFAALAAAPLVGMGDKEAADQAAVDGMRYALHSVAMDGTVVIGEGEKDEAPMLYNGERIGDGSPA